MKRISFLPLLVAVVAAAAASGQEASTPPVGVNSVACPSGSDTYVSVSFNRPTAFLGVVSLVSGSTVTPQGTPAWTANQFVTPASHFVKFITGARAGAFYEIASNSGNQLTLNLAGDTITTVTEGDKMAVIPYWTLNDLFPVGNQTIHQSASTATFARKTQVLFPNLSGSGINLTPSGLYYLTSEGWRDPLSSNAVVNPRLEPDQFLIIRHRSQDPATTFFTAGTVDSWTVRSVLATLPTAAVDNPVSNLRPVPVKLKNLGLGGTAAFVGSAGTFTFARKDVLYVYDNAVLGINKTPSHVYYYNTQTSQWMDALQSNRVADDDLILPATGYIVRKYQTAGGASSLWSHNLVAE